MGILSEKQIRHINRYYSIRSSKSVKLHKVTKQFNKLYDNLTDNHPDNGYDDYEYGSMPTITTTKQNLDESHTIFDKMTQLKDDEYNLHKEIQYLDVQFLVYLDQNNLELEDRDYEESDYTIVNGLNYE